MGNRRNLLVTGSCGLIGSEVCRYFACDGWNVYGMDSNHRAIFFGPEGDTSRTLARLREEIPGYCHAALDIRDQQGVGSLVAEVRPALIVHCAAQPSHDRAAAIPLLDFEVNALGTLHLLEAARQFAPESPFVYMSTNKVYGDRPNTIALQEFPTRWEFADARYANGIPESLSIDQSKHSLFGASKLAADVVVQEYGRYFQMPTCCLRAGCLTGPHHAGVELHGFLSYLVKCAVEGRQYRVFGYGGKQVRDNLHAADVARFIDQFQASPRAGEVYNLGGGKQNSCSILEAFAMAQEATGRPINYRYLEENRAGDHICYYSDLGKIREHYPNWHVSRKLPAIFEEITRAWCERNARMAMEPE